MIRFKKGDILNEEADALVNTVNCVGVMGRGIALQFKRAFPDNFRVYAERCRRGDMIPGEVFVYETKEMLPPKYVINFPSKRHWRGKSRIDDIEAGLTSLADALRRHDIHSIAIPPLGSGLGGLNWHDVRPLIVDALQEFADIDIVVYEPGGGPTSRRPNRSRSVPRMTAGRAALVGLMDRYLRGVLDPFVTLLEVHKLMYFMQSAGEPLKLRFNKTIYGPYAENLRHVLNAIEGHMIAGYADGGDAPDKRLTIVPGALRDARTFLERRIDTRKRFAKVVDLVQGFESGFGLELLATVHWVVDEEQARSFRDIRDGVSSWSGRKRQFTSRQIALACCVLAEKGWLAELEPAVGAGSQVLLQSCEESDARHWVGVVKRALAGEKSRGLGEWSEWTVEGYRERGMVRLSANGPDPAEAGTVGLVYVPGKFAPYVWTRRSSGQEVGGLAQVLARGTCLATDLVSNPGPE